MNHKWHHFTLWLIIITNQLLAHMKNKNNIKQSNKILPKFKKWWFHLNPQNIFLKIKILKFLKDLVVHLAINKFKVKKQTNKKYTKRVIKKTYKNKILSKFQRCKNMKKKKRFKNRCYKILLQILQLWMEQYSQNNQIDSLCCMLMWI